MSDDNEVLPIGNDLSKYMIGEGFIDFETYEQHIPKTDTCGSSEHIKAKSSSLLKNNLDCKSVEPSYRPISSNDQSKLINLLDSKLLLPDDFELIEFLISRTSTCNHQASYLWFCSGGMIASAISLALYLNKQVSFHLPAVLSFGFSFVCISQCYSYFHEIYENKSFSSSIGSLQNLCLNIHKMLRLLKETEILSTGQVTTQNVGSALYIPVKNLKELETFPPWKTLPHLRKCLANALLEMIDLLKSTCDQARKVVPNWLHIEGYSFPNETSLLNPHTVDSLRRAEGYISLKDLYLLNDAYLILQSELLRWVGFCICPGVWNTSDSNHKSSKIKILNFFHSTHSKLSVISFKLKMHYDVQKIFTEQLINPKLLRNEMAEINNTQKELHNLFLLILTILFNLKSLEDQLEYNPNNIKTIDLNILRETLSQQLKDMRNELSLAMNMFDAIYIRSFPNKKSCPVQSNTSGKEHFDGTLIKSQRNLPEVNESTAQCQINVSDEVFLAITDLLPNEKEKHRDDWGIESNPQIPTKLLSELSTTLKPIKQNFKEREKAALERAGLVDINSESDSENDTDKNLCKHSSANSTTKRKRTISKRSNYCLCSAKEDDTGSDTSLPEGDSNTNPIHTLKLNPVLSESIEKESVRTSFPVFNDKSVANLIAMKSQSWGLTEEEHYSDD